MVKEGEDAPQWSVISFFFKGAKRFLRTTQWLFYQLTSNKDERALHLPQNALAMSLIVFVASVVVVCLFYWITVKAH